MPEAGWESGEWESLRQECWRLIWPTSSFVDSQIKRFQRRKVHSAVTSSSSFTVKSEESNNRTTTTTISESVCVKRKAVSLVKISDEDDIPSATYFLHPKSFYMMEPDIHTQFHVYKPNLTTSTSDDGDEREVNNILASYCPHNKLYCRVMASTCEDETQKSRKCLCYDLAWCLMTSACLSKGTK